MKWSNKGHEFDHIGEQLKDRKKIYIYGAGENGKYACDRIKFLNCVEGFIDIDQEKKGKRLQGVEILDLESVLKNRLGTYIIVVAVSNINMINVKKSLICQGLREGLDFYGYNEFIDIYLPIHAAYAYQKIYHKGLTFVPTRRCPLNCKNCLNFIPFVKDHWEDSFESVKEQLDIFFACIDYLGILSLVGGEIFLYSRYKELFKYVGENYRDKIATLSITTSAAIIPDDETFDIFNKYDFTIHISDYRSALPGVEKTYTRFIEKLKEYDVNYVQFEDHEWLDLDVFGDEKVITEADKITHFNACGIPWQFLKDKKLYSCNWAGMAVMAGAKPDIMGDYYDLRTCTVEKKDIDEEKIDSSKKQFTFLEEKRYELMEFIMGYTYKGCVDMCSKCNGHITINTHFVPPAVQIPRKH